MKKYLVGLVALTALVGLAGCVSFGKPWMIKSAATPDGWPALTPVGEVQVKKYPVYREAVVDGDGTSSMFGALFEHLKSNDIAMTAPVDMGYEDGKMERMAFLYRKPDMGKTGTQGAVRVVDRRPQDFASIGVRGSYNDGNFKRGLAKVEQWLETSKEWEADGEPRFLGYNSPFVPWFMRYGEVQIPVKKRG